MSDTLVPAEKNDRSDTDNQHIGTSEPEIPVVVGDGDPMVEDAASSNVRFRGRRST